MDRTKSTETMLTLTAASIVFYLIFELRWILYTGIILAVIGLFCNSVSVFISAWWMKLAVVLGAIMSGVILSVVFYLILLPISMLFRMVNKDPIQLKKKQGSYFHERNHKYLPHDLEKPW